MVSVVNVQVYQCSFDMKVWYENTASKDEPGKWRNPPSSVRAMWSETLRSILKKRKLIDETLQQTTLDGPGIRTPPVLEDWFPEGKDKCLVTAGKKSLTGKDDDLSLEGKRIVLTDQVDRNRVSGGLVQRLQGNGMRSRDRLHGGQGSCDGDGILCK